MKFIKRILEFFRALERQTDAEFNAMDDTQRAEIIKFINDSTL